MIKIFLKLFFIFLIIFSTNSNVNSEEDKIKIGVLVPLSGENKEIGNLILKATKLALKDIKTNKIEIYPKDTAATANKALTSASSSFQYSKKDEASWPTFAKSSCPLAFA